MRPLSAENTPLSRARAGCRYRAGAAKSEGLGRWPCWKKIESSDPDALIGLPIFKLVDFLQAEGMDILSIFTRAPAFSVRPERPYRNHSHLNEALLAHAAYRVL